MLKLSRRHMIAGGAGLAGLAVLANRPSDKSGPRDPYFVSLQKALTDAGIATPTLVIDRARLNANIDTLMGHLPPGMGYRIVAKSLPSLDLIAHIRDRAGTDRLMTFNQPMLNTLSAHMPDASQLVGKPLPVVAAKTYFRLLSPQNVAASDQVQWLIDTPTRLAQYADLSKAVGRPFQVNIEIDVGLHRGGFVPGPDLAAALRTIADSRHLKLAGFMGYEPHLPSLPTAFGWRAAAKQKAWEIYRQCLRLAADAEGVERVPGLTRNAAGSPTYRYYQDTEIANEIAAGSCLVKPAHFDTELLEPHVPASFIATPVIKASPTQMPGLEFLDGIKRFWDPNTQRTVFIYGGHWLADPVDPPGLAYNPTFGRSSNQEMLNGGAQLDIAPDGFVFLRPQQSEAVFLQFGDIAVFDDGAIVDRWPVFEASA